MEFRLKPIPKAVGQERFVAIFTPSPSILEASIVLANQRVGILCRLPCFGFETGAVLAPPVWGRGLYGAIPLTGWAVASWPSLRTSPALTLLG